VIWDVGLAGSVGVGVGLGMSATARAGFWFGVFFVLILLWWGWGAFQADRQLENRFRELVKVVEDRNWEKLRGFLADDYVDAWGNDRERTIELAGQGFQYFLVLGVEPEEPEFLIAGREATVRTGFEISGTGRGPAKIILSRAAGLKEPFEIGWRRESWKPWDWKVVSMSQPELNLKIRSRGY